MATSPEYREYILDLLNPIHPIRARNMFGGVGIYLDETMFALISSEDILYFKTDDVNRQDYVAVEAPQFMNMPYYQLPHDVLESSDVLQVWMERAMDVARRNPKKKKKKTKKK